jgi:hypothetical protein
MFHLTPRRRTIFERAQERHAILAAAESQGRI